jgi:hypothetical protein
MPDFHQPDDADRRRAEATHAAEGDVGDWPDRVEIEELRRHARSLGVKDAGAMSRAAIVELLRTERPSSWRDPHGGDRPLT